MIIALGFALGHTSFQFHVVRRCTVVCCVGLSVCVCVPRIYSNVSYMYVRVQVHIHIEIYPSTVLKLVYTRT